MDVTVVSPLHVDGKHRRKADTTDGQALAEARKHKERTYPELCRGSAPAAGGDRQPGRRQMVPGSQGFLSCCAVAKVEDLVCTFVVTKKKCLSSSVSHDRTGKLVVCRLLSSAQETQRHSCENEQIRTLLERQKEQILADC